MKRFLAPGAVHGVLAWDAETSVSLGAGGEQCGVERGAFVRVGDVGVGWCLVGLAVADHGGQGF